MILNVNVDLTVVRWRSSALVRLFPAGDELERMTRKCLLLVSVAGEAWLPPCRFRTLTQARDFIFDVSQASLRLYKTMSVPSPQKSPLCVAIWQEHALLLLDVIVLTGKFFFSPYFSLCIDIPSDPLASTLIGRVGRLEILVSASGRLLVTGGWSSCFWKLGIDHASNTVHFLLFAYKQVVGFDTTRTHHVHGDLPRGHGHRVTLTSFQE
jgi:hypothetical protein